jgi:hypothetical protein
VIEVIDAAQVCPCDERIVTDPEHAEARAPQRSRKAAPEAANLKSETLTPNSEPPLLSLEEKREILARIVRTNALDCFDESGAFDIALAKRVLPPGAVRHIDVDETTRIDAEGQPVTQRHIRLRLVDPLSALRLDDIFERRQNPTPAFANTKMGERKTFNLLREKTMALDDALQSIEDLKQALAEADDREIQLSKKLEEKDQQLGTPTPGTPGSSLAPHPSTPDHASQGETGCQPVKPTALCTIEAPTGTRLEKLEAPPIDYEMEHIRNTSGILGFADWLRINRPAEWAKLQSQRHSTKHPATRHQKTAGGQRIGLPARSPP